MKRIPLGHRLFALVDDADFWTLAEFRWYPMKYGNSRKKRYAIRSVKNQHVYMHKAILGALKGEVVDHIDGNPLNNCRANLRRVTVAENRLNLAVRKDNRYGVPGVRFEERVQRWRAWISARGKKHYLGYFNTFEEAVVARRAAEELHFAEFRRDGASPPAKEEG